MARRRRSLRRQRAGSARRRLIPHRRPLRLELLEDRRMLATIPVTNLADFGAGSLRQAIISANNMGGADTIDLTGVAGTIAVTLGEMEITEEVTIEGPGADQLTIDAQQNSRIFNFNASLGDFTIRGLTLTGGRTTGDGLDASDDTFRGGAIRSLTNGTLTIDASIVTDNHTEGDHADGGAIFSYGSLTITDSTISGNSAAGLLSDGGAVQVHYGNFTLTRSTVTGNSTAGYGAQGGAAYTAGYARVVESTIDSNSTTGDYGHGGGMFLRTGSIVLTASTISNNQTSGDFADGGGIGSSTIDDVDVTIRQSTISGNLTFGSNADAGGVLATGDLSVDQSTITKNRATYGNATAGGVLNGSGRVSITTSIVADNTAGGGSPDIDPGSGTLDINYSLIGVDPGGIVGTGNLTGMQPTLGPMAFNGGATQTHALLAGSLGIDAGDPAVTFSPTEFDQRGDPFVRVVDGGVDGRRIDMGAFERQNLSGTLVVDTTVDESDGDFSVGDLSLREAIELANGTAVDTIEFDPVVFATPQTILLELGEMQIGEAVTIDGPGQDLLTIDAKQNSRIFNIVAETGDVLLRGLTLTGGRTMGSGIAISDRTFAGGAIRSVSTGTLTVEDGVLTGNSTEGVYAGGGAISSNFGALTITSSTLSGNSTMGDFSYGGGIFNDSGAVTIANSTLLGNSTAGSAARGGGIFARSGAVMLTDSILSGNSTMGSGSGGGGILSLFGTVTITSSTLSGNSTAGDLARGGGIDSNTGAVTITNSTISGNSTAGDNARAGGIYNVLGALTLTGSTISGNSTAGDNSDGGAIDNASGTVTITSSTIAGNYTTGVGSDGGGIRLADTVNDPPLTIQNSIVAGNTVAAGSTNPDIFHDPDGVFDVDYSLIGDPSGLTLSQLLVIAGNGNLSNNDPMLGPLAYNGGPTKTHALLSGSPAIDAGDPSIGTAPDEFDQRGDPFLRVRQGTQGGGVVIDMGAYERQGIRDPRLEVDTAVDESDGDYSTGDLSLREALGLANGDLGANTVTFSQSLYGETISLVLGQLDITDSVTIEGLRANQLTIDAQQSSRVFNIDDGDDTVHQFVEISGLTITGGEVEGDGAGIRSRENLELVDTVVTGNSATGSALGTAGGGIYLRMFGGMTAAISGSTISNNSSTGSAGGVHVQAVAGDSLEILSSTISGNTADTTAGGIRTTGGTANILHSTIAFNIADANMSGLGGVGGIFDSSGLVTLDHTIVSSNTDTTGPENDLDGTFTANFSLIGDDTGAMINGANNILNQNARLEPLADNGGPTPTHALMDVSPALDSGNIGIVSPPQFDQRGPGFTRIFGVRIDRGAFEVQPLPPAFFGDYNQNGVVDAADFTVWRDTLGLTGLVPYSGADGNGDGAVTQVDYQVWVSHFGQVFPVAGAASAVPVIALAEPVAPVVADDGPADQPLAPSGERAAARANLDFSFPIDLETRIGSDARPQRATLAATHPAPSPRAVDLLLAVTNRPASDDRAEDFVAISNGATDEPATDEATAAAFDLALAAFAADS